MDNRIGYWENHMLPTFLHVDIRLVPQKKQQIFRKYIRVPSDVYKCMELLYLMLALGQLCVYCKALMPVQNNEDPIFTTNVCKHLSS